MSNRTTSRLSLLFLAVAVFASVSGCSGGSDRSDATTTASTTANAASTAVDSGGRAPDGATSTPDAASNRGEPARDGATPRAPGTSGGASGEAVPVGIALAEPPPASPNAPGTAPAAGGVLPYQAYGSGVRAGALVEAYERDAVVGSVRADNDGNWVLQIAAARGAPGEEVAFRLDGVPQAEKIVFRNGGFPPPPGVALTPAT